MRGRCRISALNHGVLRERIRLSAIQRARGDCGARDRTGEANTCHPRARNMRHRAAFEYLPDTPRQGTSGHSHAGNIQPANLSPVVADYKTRVKAIEGNTVMLALVLESFPAQSGLSSFHNKKLQQRAVIVDRHAPFVIVITDGKLTPRPRAMVTPVDFLAIRRSSRPARIYCRDFGSDLFLGDFLFSTESNSLAAAGTPTLPSRMISLALNFLP